MASRVLSKNGPLIVYLRGLEFLCHRSSIFPQRSLAIATSNIHSKNGAAARTFSSSPKGEDNLPSNVKPFTFKESSKIPDSECVNSREIKALPWLKIKDGILGPSDARVCLPGAVGVVNSETDSTVLTILPPHTTTTHEVNQTTYNYEKQIDTISSLQSEYLMTCSIDPYLLECKAQTCPQLLIADLQPLFPNFPISEMTSITLSQRTKNDMSSWSDSQEEEREVLLKQFIDAAQQICASLSAEGYWADFVDPVSGRPFYGDFTNDTLFETDDRYRSLGFTIEDLGCCKVISHGTFGTHVFVGALFTDAPVNSDAIRDTLETQAARAPITEQYDN